MQINIALLHIRLMLIKYEYSFQRHVAFHIWKKLIIYVKWAEIESTGSLLQLYSQCCSLIHGNRLQLQTKWQSFPLKHICLSTEFQHQLPVVGSIKAFVLFFNGFVAFTTTRVIISPLLSIYLMFVWILSFDNIPFFTLLTCIIFNSTYIVILLWQLSEESQEWLQLIVWCYSGTLI